MNSKLQVIIDTDVDIDDWMAILFLMKHPGVEVLGITTTGCGAAHLTPGALNARNLLMLSAHPETPVAAGTSAPLLYSNQFPNSIRLGIDQLFGLTLPSNPRPLDPRTAVQFLKETILAAPSPVTVLAIGGGTNLGTLLRDHPEVKPKIARVVVMGGAISVKGNIFDVDGNYLNSVAEWNIFLDVLGARILLESGVPITLVPLDASQYVPLNAAFYDRLTANNMSRAAKFIHDALTADLSFVNSGNFYFWDPLAAAILVEPNLAVFNGPPLSPEVMQLEVLQTLDEEKDTSGQLVRSTQGSSIEVAMWANAETFYQRFLDVINLPDPC